MYDFRALSPIDFEELVRDLLQAELRILIESFGPGRDQGIDFRFAVGLKTTIVQAKHYADTGFSGLLAAAKKENGKIKSLNPARYIFATSVSLTPAQKSRIQQAMPAVPLAARDVLGKADLNNLLGRHDEIERKHFKLWLSSSTVLERILHSGVYNRTAIEMELIQGITSKFVHNESVPAAEAILSKSGTLIVSGEPGVGKTTLARMLVWLHAEQGWHVTVIDDIQEAYDITFDKKKHIVFFDDFLGQVQLSTDLVRGMDQRLPPFLEKVRTHKHLRFVLTTRDYILHQAQSHSRRLASPAIDTNQFMLNVGHYTRSARAKILYNHLYFSDLVKSDLEALLADKLFLRMIDHKNFNPRLIELLTNADYLALAEKPIRQVVETVLENPRELWEIPYRTHLTSEARALMLAVYFNGPRIELSDLEGTFERILDMMGLQIADSERPPAFRRSLKELEGSVLAIEKRRVRFANPGVRDFLDRVVEDDRIVPLAIKALTEYSELNQCWELIEEGKTAKQQNGQFRLDWVDAVGRVILGSSGTALTCLKLALDSYALFPGQDLLVHVVTAAAMLEQDTADESELSICQATLETLVAAGLPSAEADETREILTVFTIEAFRGAAWALGLGEVESAANSLLKYGSQNPGIERAIHEALEAQIENIDDMMEGIDTLDDLHVFERDLVATFTKYGYKKKGYEYYIERRQDRIMEGDIHPRSANYGSIQRNASTEATNEEIESMFQGLLK
ncbi:restriction endonuclease [Bradyrhizobium sp. CW4]|uniref:nSTAND3 domain-containing NTPase n=1 Tax=Bradyrhizobium sp. CW4 TaxID=2782687 RepID=UPI001FF918AF|nr:restriction endonuclease [Bradyrhizobium sp. CW4]MCK1417637.1 restriction endonuclease [Bradyrhizobium sp. CW4]